MVDVDILETVKTGDNLTINKYPDIGLGDAFQQESRTVTGITTSDAVTTNTYIDAGITTVRTLQRPAYLEETDSRCSCKQYWNW